MDPNLLIIYTLLASLGLVLWMAARWNPSRDSGPDPLSPADLAALKAACENLILDLRSAAAESTRQVEAAISRAEIIASKLDDSLPVKIVIEDDDEDELTAGDEVIVSQESEYEVKERIAEAADAFRRVYDLADQGLSAVDIARSENRSPGEVKLLLDIRDSHIRQKAA